MLVRLDAAAPAADLAASVMTPPRPRDEDGEREPQEEQDPGEVVCGPVRVVADGQGEP